MAQEIKVSGPSKKNVATELIATSEEPPSTSLNASYSTELDGNSNITTSILSNSDRAAVLVQTLFIAFGITTLFGATVAVFVCVSKRHTRITLFGNIRRRSTRLFLSSPPPYEECVRDVARSLLTSPQHVSDAAAAAQPPAPSSHHSGLWMGHHGSPSVPDIRVTGEDAARREESVSSLPPSLNLLVRTQRCRDDIDDDHHHLTIDDDHGCSRSPSASSYGSSRSSCSCSCSDCSCRGNVGKTPLNTTWS